MTRRRSQKARRQRRSRTMRRYKGGTFISDSDSEPSPPSRPRRRKSSSPPPPRPKQPTPPPPISNDPYIVLGVSRTSSASSIKKAYHKLALKWHPDKGRKNATEIFQRIGSAYETIRTERGF